MITKREVIFAAAGAVVGGAVGFGVGYTLLKKKVTKDNNEKLDNQMSQLVKSKENYDKLIKEKEEESKNTVEKETPEETDISQKEYEEMVDKLEYEDFDILQEQHFTHRDPKVLGKSPVDKDDPDISFPRESLTYYMGSELLVNESGDLLDETDTIGNNPRRYGFLQGRGDANAIWVRNYDLETDYLVTRTIRDISEDYDIQEESDEE